MLLFKHPIFLTIVISLLLTAQAFCDSHHSSSCKLNKHAALTKLIAGIYRCEEERCAKQEELTLKIFCLEDFENDLERKCGFENVEHYFQVENEIDVGNDENGYCNEEDVAEEISKRKKENYEQIRTATINCINKYRELHGAHPLKSNAAITKAAQTWAEKIVKEIALMHQSGGKYGENIWSFNSWPAKTPHPEEPCKSWYSESKGFNFNKESLQNSGHFTQMVWKASKEIGVGVAKSGGKWVLVADFYPPGNIVGHVLQNVKPKIH